nr:hypothetical protein [Rhizobium ruizarguesonis]
MLSQPLSAMRQSALGNALSTILAPLWSLAFREQHESPAITIADGMELRVQTAHPFFRRLAAVRGPSDVLASIMICSGLGAFAGRSGENPVEHAEPAPANEAVVERRRKTEML